MRALLRWSAVIALFAAGEAAADAGWTRRDTGWMHLYEDTVTPAPQAAFNHRFSDQFSGYFRSGDAADTGASGILAAGGEARFYTGEYGESSLTFDGRHEERRGGDMQTFSSGFRHALPDDWVSMTARSVAACDENGVWQHGWRARIDTQAAERLRLHAGFASDLNMFDDTVVDAESQFFGFDYEVDERFRVQFDYHREDREESFLQRVFRLGLTARLGAWLSGYFKAYVTPESDAPHQRDFGAGGIIRLYDGDLGSFSLILDGRRAAYRRGDVDIQSTGFRHDFLGGRAWLTAQLVSIDDTDGDWWHGWRTRLNAPLTPRLRLRAGLTDVREVSQDATLDAETQFVGFAFLEEGFDFHLDYRREDRANTSPQQALTLGLTAWF